MATNPNCKYVIGIELKNSQVDFSREQKVSDVGGKLDIRFLLELLYSFNLTACFENQVVTTKLASVSIYSFI